MQYYTYNCCNNKRVITTTRTTFNSRQSKNETQKMPPTGKRRSTASMSASALIAESEGDSKVARKSKNDTPSRLSNAEGRTAVNRSILCHPLGLPLFKFMNGEDPQALPYLKTEVVHDGEDSHTIDKVFQDSYDDWMKMFKNTEPKLTKDLAGKIADRMAPLPSNAKNITAFNEIRTGDKDEHDGHIDILQSNGTKKKDTQNSTPYAVIEFGMNGLDWWSKVHQNVLYANRMCSKTEQAAILQFEKPILMATVTVDLDKERLTGKRLPQTPDVEVRMGVFLCTRKDGHNNPYRISLIGHAEFHSIQEASQWFGRFLRATVLFSHWRNEDAETNAFRYLSSNCCKVEKEDGTPMILRNYDSRIRKTSRSPQVYLQCSDIVGDGVETVVQFPPSSKNSNETKKELSPGDRFWCMDGRDLKIIATPFREGGHVAESPRAFLPVIDHLQKLHKMGFVHGDIRAYNTVFEKLNDPVPVPGAAAVAHTAAAAPGAAPPGDEDAPGATPAAEAAAAAVHDTKTNGRNQNLNDDETEDRDPEGWLIDFDFGGKEDERLLYPDGYKDVLPDGSRVGKEKEQICKWHDWYALGTLIFTVHELRGYDPERSLDDMKDKWTRGLKKSKQPPSDEDINDLKRFLKDEKWTVLPSAQFEHDLDKFTAEDTGKIKTHHGATGTPFKK